MMTCRIFPAAIASSFADVNLITQGAVSIAAVEWIAKHERNSFANQGGGVSTGQYISELLNEGFEGGAMFVVRESGHAVR